MTSRIDELFKEKNITLCYNTLGITEEARRNYVGFTRSILQERNVKKSQHVKLDCYKLICPFLESRKKFTGFEAFLNIEFQCRINLKSIVTPNPDTTKAYDNNHTFISTHEKYEEILVSEIKKETKPKLLYLSGGLDSELVAYILLKNGIEFKPVIFQWINDKNNVLNLEEVSYAFKFCERNAITPVVENFDVNNFWTSSELLDLATELNIGSPHVLTHAKMIMIMDKKFPGYSHYFGGEVRYIMDMPRNDTEKLDLVFSEKLAYSTTYGYPIATPGGILSTVYDNLYYGWTNMYLQLQGAGGGGRENYGSSLGSQAGGGGGGGQGRTLVLTKASSLWIKSVKVTGNNVAGGPGNALNPSSRNGNLARAILYTEVNGTGSTWKTIAALGGGGAELNGAGPGDHPAGWGGDAPPSNDRGNPIADDGSIEYLRVLENCGAGSSNNNNGGGGAASRGTASTNGGNASASQGGNGAHQTFASGATLSSGSSVIGYFGAGGGGGGAPGTSNGGGNGGLGGETGTNLTVGGSGGDGTAFGNGQNGLGGWGGGGGGAGGGATAGNGGHGQIRLNYWRT